MKCNVWVHMDREYNIFYKEDKRQSVTLNHPSQRQEIEKQSDFWENSFPYSNKNVKTDQNGIKVKEIDVRLRNNFMYNLV